MSRMFTLAEAQALLPEVERLLNRAGRCRDRYAEAECEAAELKRRILVSGGMHLAPERLAAVRTGREEAALGLKESLEALAELGVQVKDLDDGLVDFPTRFRGAEVLLCWKRGEPGISWWHGTEEGFRGRKRIDRDFLDHHEGA
jgi:hypothetical protein